MKKIVLQAGHQNIQFNSIVELRTSTGAPQEQVHNLAIVNRASELLRQRGFEVKQTDANANDDKNITSVDWDLFLAVHCDSDSATVSAGFADYPFPATDGATQESQRIAGVLNQVFYPETGITFRPERIQKSVDIQYYYMWKYLSTTTPCVLIEMGESVDPHDINILNDTERCAIALTRAICKAFNVAYDLPTPTPPSTSPTPVPQPPIPPIIPPVQANPDYKTALLNIKPIASKFHFFYSADFKKILAEITKVNL
jgi:N-acetylmuramoyl-L-alanine amidase